MALKGTEREVFDNAQALKERDKPRDRMFRAMDKMFHNSSAPPGELASRDWFRWTPTTTPSDAVWGATRVLSAIEPNIEFAPISYTGSDRERADRIGRVLKTLYMQAGRRSKSKHTRQIVWNAVLYDSVAIQLDFLPFTLDNTDLMGGSEKRLRSTRRYGPFAIHVRNAKNVHTVHSEWGLEQVLFEQVLPLREVIKFWGDAAPKDLQEMVEGDNTVEWVYLMDYWDDEKRAVWVHTMEDYATPFMDAIQNPQHWLVKPKDHGLPFIPWVSAGGGSTTEASPELHHRPLLASIYHTDQYNTMNIIRSLLVSDEIAKFAEEETVEETHTGEPAATTREGAIGPRNSYNIQVGEKIYRLPQSQLDQGLLELHRVLQDDMSASTVSRILLGEVPNDVAFSTLNLGQQSASRSIIPYKEVGQDALSELFTQMLMWSNFAQEDLHAFIARPDGSGREAYRIVWDEFDPDLIQIDVELVTDVPTDQTSKINASAMAYERVGASQKWALENMGIADADLVQNERFQEDLMTVEKQNAMMLLSEETQKQMMEIAQQQAQEMMAPLIEKLEQLQAGAEPGENLGQGGPGMAGIEGMGTDPASGGAVPAQFNPSATREQQTGQTRTGEELA